MAKKKMPAAVLDYFRKEGEKGAKVRMQKLTPEQRSAIAKKAAAARWKKAEK